MENLILSKYSDLFHHKYMMKDLTQYLLIELTLPKLHKSAVDAFPRTKKRQHATDELKVAGIQFIPYEGALKIKAVIKNVNDGKTYDSTIFVNNIVYEKEDSPKLITFTGSDGEDYHIRPIPALSSHAKVHCECLDFRWRFAEWNYNKDALDGKKPDQYIPKTNRPPANPTQSPGICKHLMKMIETLENSNLIK